MNGNGTADTRFECTWLNKLSRCLGAGAGERVRDEVMAGSDGLTDRTSRGDVIAWTQRAMERLESAVEQEQARQIMVGCACSHPREELAEMRRVYAQTDDVDRAHAMLQAHFEAFLRNTLKPCEAMIAEAVRRGWDLAGIKQGKHDHRHENPQERFPGAVPGRESPRGGVRSIATARACGRQCADDLLSVVGPLSPLVDHASPRERQRLGRRRQVA